MLVVKGNRIAGMPVGKGISEYKMGKAGSFVLWGATQTCLEVLHNHTGAPCLGKGESMMIKVM
jgi:hypothetical protein